MLVNKQVGSTTRMASLQHVKTVVVVIVVVIVVVSSKQASTA